MEILKSTYNKAKKAPIHNIEDFPISRIPTTGNLTGSWRTLQPVFREGIAPCSEGCPNNMNIPKCMGFLQEGKLDEALEVIRQDNPLPAVTGRVCPHFCEQKCNRAEFDSPVNVHAVERFIGDYGLHIPMKKYQDPGKRKVASVGSGPAGLSAGYFLAKHGVEVDIFDRLSDAGGILRYGIPEYRLPREILNREIRNILDLGISFFGGRDMGPEDIVSLCKQYDYVFLAPGLWGINIPDWGYGKKGVYDGLSLLRDIHSGNGPELGRRVFVIGGGNTAFDVARVLMRLGKEVTIVYRRTLEEAPAFKEEVLEAREENIRILERKLITHIENQDGFLRVYLQDAIKQDDGKIIPKGEKEEHIIDSLVAAIGQISDLRVGESENIIMGGDYESGEGTVAQAIASGKRGAFKILNGLGLSEKKIGDEYFRSEGDANGGEVIGYDRINPSYFKKSKGFVSNKIEPEDRLRGFDEIVQDAPLGEVLKESCRCFSCGNCILCGSCWYFCPDACVITGNEEAGKVRFDKDFCKGCAICSVVCPRGCIGMEEE